jgi:hypothetical protein
MGMQKTFGGRASANGAAYIDDSKRGGAGGPLTERFPDCSVSVFREFHQPAKNSFDYGLSPDLGFAHRRLPSPKANPGVC